MESAISETMRLVEVGFKDFEARYRKDNSLSPLVEEPKSDDKATKKDEPTTISQQA